MSDSEPPTRFSMLRNVTALTVPVSVSEMVHVLLDAGPTRVSVPLPPTTAPTPVTLPAPAADPVVRSTVTARVAAE